MVGYNFAKNEIIYRLGVNNMIIMDIKIDNLYAFKDFHMNMSYPKKIINSPIEHEFLDTRPNFRYKKLNIVMGSNATGKTSLGKIIMLFTNYMQDGNINMFKQIVNDLNKEASLQIDFVTCEDKLYRFKLHFMLSEETPSTEKVCKDVITSLVFTPINKRDNYEICANRINDGLSTGISTEDVNTSGWCFSYPKNSYKNDDYKIIDNDEKYITVLSKVLKTLDPSIIEVKKIDEVDHSYAIKYRNHSVILQDKAITNPEKLSSGTKSGIEISYQIASLLLDRHDFYYCDEMFSYITSEIERAVLSLMVENLQGRKQLFFTTHNTDILDMQLPFHAFTFLKKTLKNSDYSIQCICASEILKRNTDSLKNAVENDLFNISPNLEELLSLSHI